MVGWRASGEAISLWLCNDQRNRLDERSECEEERGGAEREGAGRGVVQGRGGTGRAQRRPTAVRWRTGYVEAACAEARAPSLAASDSAKLACQAGATSSSICGMLSYRLASAVSPSE